MERRNGDGEKNSGRIKGCRRNVARLTPGQTGSCRNLDRASAGERSQARSCHGALREPGKRHASNAPASLHGESAGSCRHPSRRPERTRRSSVRMSAPCAVPFVVTNRTQERNRAGRALVVCRFAAASNAVGFSFLLLEWCCWLRRKGVRTFYIRCAVGRRWPSQVASVLSRRTAHRD